MNGDLATWAALAATAVKFTSLLKYLTARQFRQAVTTVTPWVAGVAALAVGAHANVMDKVTLPGGGPPLSRLDVGSIVLAGIALGASGSFVFDFKKAVDGTDSAVEPPLGGP